MRGLINLLICKLKKTCLKVLTMLLKISHIYHFVKLPEKNMTQSFLLVLFQLFIYMYCSLGWVLFDELYTIGDKDWH